MTKTEFLNFLRNKLAIIEENELNDILNEYEQHIEMKVQNDHVSEEEAIKDFGDIKELVAEILESYHVNVDYDVKIKEEKHNQMKENAKEIGENTKNFISGGFKKVCNKIKCFFKKCSDKIKKVFSKKDHILDKQTYACEKANKTGGTCKNILKACLKLISRCIAIIWNIFVIGFIAFIAIFGLIMLYVSGTALVMLIQKYPMWGIFIVSLGCTLLCGAAIFGLYLLIKRHKILEYERVIKITAIGLVLAGVILGGIGTGVGFAEFTSFSYGGEKIINEKEGMVYKCSIKIPMENIESIDTNLWITDHIQPEIVYDKAVPYGVVECEITDNTEGRDYFMEAYETSDDDQMVSIGFNVYPCSDTLKEMMALKNAVLEDIKNRELCSYKTSDVTAAKVILNPEMKKYIK